MSKIKIIWTNTAKDQLKTIFNYYKERSHQGARNLKNDILNATKNIHFKDQFQQDEIQPEFRRIIIRDYKLLYKEENNIIYIVRIFSTKLNPANQV